MAPASACYQVANRDDFYQSPRCLARFRMKNWRLPRASARQKYHALRRGGRHKWPRGRRAPGARGRSSSGTMEINGATMPGTDFDKVVVSSGTTTFGGSLVLRQSRWISRWIKRPLVRQGKAPWKRLHRMAIRPEGIFFIWDTGSDRMSAGANGGPINNHRTFG